MHGCGCRFKFLMQFLFLFLKTGPFQHVNCFPQPAGADAAAQPRSPSCPVDRASCARPQGHAPTPRALYHPRDSTNNLHPPPEKQSDASWHVLLRLHPSFRRPLASPVNPAAGGRDASAARKHPGASSKCPSPVLAQGWLRRAEACKGTFGHPDGLTPSCVVPGCTLCPGERCCRNAASGNSAQRG